MMVVSEHAESIEDVINHCSKLVHIQSEYQTATKKVMVVADNKTLMVSCPQKNA